MRQDGKIQLKTSHPHIYQVQTAMDIMNLNECDYVVWTPYTLVIVSVTYSPFTVRGTLAERK